jgi:hypothetical protein
MRRAAQRLRRQPYSSAMLSTAGLAILGAGLALMAAIGQGANVHGILWQAFVCGVGFGLFQTPNNREMLGTVAREHLGAASGVLALARTFGQTVGMALAALALAAAGGAGRRAERVAQRQACAPLSAAQRAMAVQPSGHGAGAARGTLAAGAAAGRAALAQYLLSVSRAPGLRCVAKWAVWVSYATRKLARL